MKKYCDAIERSRNRQCTRMVNDEFSLFCDLHKNWNGPYIDPEKYPVVESHLRIIGRHLMPNGMGLCYRITRSNGQSNCWVSVERMTRPEMVSMIVEWDRKNEISLEVETFEPSPEYKGFFVVKWRHYPPAFNTLEPRENLGQ